MKNRGYFRIWRRNIMIGAVLVLVGIAISPMLSRRSKAQPATLTGNWAVKTPRNDGTFAKVYFNLKQEGVKITGSIRSTQFYYQIVESTGTSDEFTITGKMRDGKSDRSVEYDGKLVGDELHLSTRRPNQSHDAFLTAREFFPQSLRYRLSIRSRITVWLKLRRWVGIAGTSSRVE